MIVVTGAAGFIGSCMIAKLNEESFNEIIAVDKFDNPEKLQNLEGKNIRERVDRDVFFEWLDEHQHTVEFIIHLGARTDTTLNDASVFKTLNLEYSKKIWNSCIEYALPFIYASSAATYGDGTLGYSDNQDIIKSLQPLNEYGISKNEFDKWILKQDQSPFFWAGLKFFNVFGPNEYHKSRMASVAYHAFNQIKATGKVKLFRSHHPNFEDGKQIRDFIYVKDVIKVIYWLIHHRKDSGIYNLGTGTGRTFLDLVNGLFDSLSIESNIEFIDTPIDIRGNYQYFTEADMDKLKTIGYSDSFTDLSEGINDYVQYLKNGSYL